MHQVEVLALRQRGSHPGPDEPAARAAVNASHSSSATLTRTLHIGSLAPDFEADSTTGRIRFHAWLGRSWGVLFSHPKDFTPVCTTELGRAAALKTEFVLRDVKILAVSVDRVESHLAWTKDIEDTQGVK